MCYRVEIRANCGGGVQQQKLTHLMSMLEPGAIEVSGTPDGWTAAVHVHAESAERAKSMALMRLTSASSNAHLPPALSLRCHAEAEVDRPPARPGRPFLSST